MRHLSIRQVPRSIRIALDGKEGHIVVEHESWDEGEVDDRTAVAIMIADWHGRSVIETDYELADAIILHLTPKS